MRTLAEYVHNGLVREIVAHVFVRLKQDARCPGMRDWRVTSGRL